MLIPQQDENAVPERYKTCLSNVDGNLGWILSRFFIESAFSAASKELGNKIIKDIKSIYIERLARLDWMDDSVKALAEKKVNNIVQKVGYPDTVSLRTEIPLKSPVTRLSWQLGSSGRVFQADRHSSVYIRPCAGG